MYHAVEPDPSLCFLWTQLDRDTFYSQMQYIKGKFSVTRLSRLLDKQVQFSRPPLAITFDDGLESTYVEAWAILKKLGLCATCFVVPGQSEAGMRIWTDELYIRLLSCLHVEIDLTSEGLGLIPNARSMQDRMCVVTALVEKLKLVNSDQRGSVLEKVKAACHKGDSSLSTRFRLMSKEQIIELAQSEEFDIGEHGDTHPILATLSPETQKEDIGRGFDRLRAWG